MRRLWVGKRRGATSRLETVCGLRSAVRGRMFVEGRNSRAQRLTTYSLQATAHGLLALFLTTSLAGCSHIEPWVKPYERSAFADPIMSADRNPASSAYIDHVHEVREAARGASGGAGGGCGCN